MRTAQLDAFRREVGTAEAAEAQRWWSSELRCMALEVALGLGLGLGNPNPNGARCLPRVRVKVGG